LALDNGRCSGGSGSALLELFNLLGGDGRREERRGSETQHEFDLLHVFFENLLPIGTRRHSGLQLLGEDEGLLPKTGDLERRGLLLVVDRGHGELDTAGVLEQDSEDTSSDLDGAGLHGGQEDGQTATVGLELGEQLSSTLVVGKELGDERVLLLLLSGDSGQSGQLQLQSRQLGGEAGSAGVVVLKTALEEHGVQPRARLGLLGVGGGTSNEGRGEGAGRPGDSLGEVSDPLQG